jgi:hypothetical protein
LSIKGNIAVIDGSYHGTKHNGLINLFEKLKANVVGVYIGLNSTKSYVDNNRFVLMLLYMIILTAKKWRKELDI